MCRLCLLSPFSFSLSFLFPSFVSFHFISYDIYFLPSLSSFSPSLISFYLPSLLAVFFPPSLISLCLPSLLAAVSIFILPSLILFCLPSLLAVFFLLPLFLYVFPLSLLSFFLLPLFRSVFIPPPHSSWITATSKVTRSEWSRPQTSESEFRHCSQEAIWPFWLAEMVPAVRS